MLPNQKRGGNDAITNLLHYKGFLLLSVHSENFKCLAYVSDRTQLPLALFAAKKAATVSRNRDFDILICSFEPVVIPTEIAELGVRNIVLPLREKLSQLNLRIKWLPLEAYLRLWLPQYLGHQYSRILYADTDTYLCAPDLTDLFDVDMGPYEIAGVRDVQQWINLDAQVHDFLALNMPAEKCLNSGVMLIDSERFVATRLLERLLEINASDTPTTQHDQSLFNLVLRGKWAELSPVWNWQWMQKYPVFTRQVTPHMLHFVGFKKPWRAHRRRTRFAPTLIREYQEFFDKHGGEMAFKTLLPGGRRTPIVKNLRSWHYARSHPEVLQQLTGRFATPFDTLL